MAAAGAFLENEEVLICGGYNGSFVVNTCYRMSPTNVSLHTRNLSIDSSFSSAGLVKGDNVLITGGARQNGHTTARKEFIAMDSQSKGPNLPLTLHSHCMIRIPSDESFLVTGGTDGNSAALKYTWHLSRNDESGWMFNDGPSMNQNRTFHACESFTDDTGNLILAVVGGGFVADGRDTVEFLVWDIQNEEEWISRKYIYTS